MQTNRLWSPLCAALCFSVVTPGLSWANPDPSPVGFSGASTVLGTTVTGATAGGFLDPVQGYDQQRSVGFTVFGLPESTVTRWHYTFTGSIEAATDNAALQLQATFAWDLRHSIGAIHYTSWGVAWVDGPPEFGDFAGNLANPPGTHAAGYPLPTTWSPGTFSGTGSIDFVTEIPLVTGTQGFYSHAVGMGLRGSIQSTLNVSLVAITYDLPLNTTLRNDTPYLLLDDGSQFAMTSSVPEPHAGLLALGGVVALGWLGSRRRLSPAK